MTTCKRFDYFIQTIDAFRSRCLDFDKIDRVIVSDDNSSEEERRMMQERYPNFEFVWQNCGHPQSLDLLFKMVHTKYFFHLEDDRVLRVNLDLLTLCEEILEESNVDSFIPGLLIGKGTKKQTKSKRGIDYYIHEFIDDGKFWSDFTEGNSSWPGFYLAPGFHRTKSIQSIPYRTVPQHERSYALEYHAAGFKVAFNSSFGIFDHLTEVSAYNDITHAPR